MFGHNLVYYLSHLRGIQIQISKKFISFFVILKNQQQYYPFAIQMCPGREKKIFLLWQNIAH